MEWNKLHKKLTLSESVRAKEGNQNNQLIVDLFCSNLKD